MSGERKAGRTLDAEIAEKVIGWGWMTSRPDHTQILPFKRWLVPPEEYGDWGHEYPADLSLPMEDPWWLDEVTNSTNVRVPHYSTSIEAAWLVLEKLRETVAGRVGIAVYEKARCLVWFKESGFEPIDVVADTAPLSICLAAVQAMEGKP